MIVLCSHHHNCVPSNVLYMYHAIYRSHSQFAWMIFRLICISYTYAEWFFHLSIVSRHKKHSNSRTNVIEMQKNIPSIRVLLFSVLEIICSAAWLLCWRKV